ncbi:DUF4307 domain-containing protein (plasmid) [Coraliomargarita sp. W4R53]
MTYSLISEQKWKRRPGMTNQQMLDERYGRSTPLRQRITIAIAIVVGAVAVVALGWMVVAGTADAADADATGFEVVDEHSVTLRFQVTVAPGKDVVCAIEAQDEDFGVVGWRVVSITASDSASREFSETIPTTALATTGFVNSCWVS